MKENPGYLKLRQIRAAQHIAQTLAQSQNRVYLSSDSLMINLRDMVKVKVGGVSLQWHLLKVFILCSLMQ